MCVQTTIAGVSLGGGGEVPRLRGARLLPWTLGPGARGILSPSKEKVRTGTRMGVC